VPGPGVQLKLEDGVAETDSGNVAPAGSWRPRSVNVCPASGSEPETPKLSVPPTATVRGPIADSTGGLLPPVSCTTTSTSRAAVAPLASVTRAR
jgi:hypothetical protein